MVHDHEYQAIVQEMENGSKVSTWIKKYGEAGPKFPVTKIIEWNNLLYGQQDPWIDLPKALKAISAFFHYQV